MVFSAFAMINDAPNLFFGNALGKPKLDPRKLRVPRILGDDPTRFAYVFFRGRHTVAGA